MEQQQQQQQRSAERVGGLVQLNLARRTRLHCRLRQCTRQQATQHKQLRTTHPWNAFTSHVAAQVNTLGAESARVDLPKPRHAFVLN
jgi:hypothetical protein